MRVTAALVTVSALLMAPAAANAATITPNVFTDELDATNANCSLREAISIANADINTAEPDCPIAGTFSGGGTDTISLAGGTAYELAETGTDDTNVDGDLDIDTTTGPLTIDGVGAAQSGINTAGGWTDRVLHQTAGLGTLTLNDLRIAGGDLSTGGLGGGILTDTAPLSLNGVRVTNNDAQISGGVGHYTASSLSITDSLIDNNTASVQAGVTASGSSALIDSTVIRENTSLPSGPSIGGGLATGANNATVTITDSLIADNDVITTTMNPLGAGVSLLLGGGSPTATVRNTTVTGNDLLNSVGMVLDGQGGGMRIDMTGVGTVNLVNSTVTGNRAEEMGGIDAFGNAGSTLNIVHTTIGQNEATTTASAIRQSMATVNLRGSVIDDAAGGVPACDGTFTSLGFNVGSDASCDLDDTGDEELMAPMLGGLLPNGGQLAGPPGFLETVPTQEPALGSTVIDHVPAANCTDVPMGMLTMDQRLLGRPVDRDGSGVAQCDAGSVELQLPPPPPIVNPPVLTPQPAPTTQPAPKKKCKRKKNKRKRGDANKKKRCKKQK